MRALAATSAALTVLLASCPAQVQARAGNASVSTGAAGQAVQQLRVEVVETLAHDPGAFTQGLELKDRVLYEGTGLIGRSSLLAGPPGGEPTRRAALAQDLFGEGLTLVGGRIWQLTWRNGFAIEWDVQTLQERRRVAYEGEGWGLCLQHGRDRLVMSDGSSVLTFRDPASFAEQGSVRVRLEGRPPGRLNELECTPDGSVYANVWPTDRIVRIDPSSGAVTAVVDASRLLTAEDKRAGAHMLNGIAAVRGTEEFLLTGKLWPKLFRVRFVAAE